MTISENDPAGRLLCFLLRVSTTEGNWHQILHLSEGVELSRVAYLLAGVMKMPEEIVSYVIRFGWNEKTYIETWRESVARALEYLFSDLKEFRRCITDESITALRFVSARLEEERVEFAIDEEQLHELKTQLNALITLAQDAKLDAEFRIFVLEHLDVVRRSIEEYVFFGANGVKKSMRIVYGSIMTDPGMWRSNELPGFWNVMGKIASIFTVAQGGYELTGDVIEKFLPR